MESSWPSPWKNGRYGVPPPRHGPRRRAGRPKFGFGRNDCVNFVNDCVNEVVRRLFQATVVDEIVPGVGRCGQTRTTSWAALELLK